MVGASGVKGFGFRESGLRGLGGFGFLRLRA